MNDLLAQVFAEAAEYILEPLHDDEFTPVMLAEADPLGASPKVWNDRMKKMVKSGKATMIYRLSDTNKKMTAYKLVKP
jgi:hypothetical protein